MAELTCERDLDDDTLLAFSDLGGEDCMDEDADGAMTRDQFKSNEELQSCECLLTEYDYVINPRQ